jgi:PPOX class probable F420-dependent enzyme
VEIERAQEFLRTNHRAVLATYRADGTVQMSPVTVGVDSAGRVAISSRETAIKVKHLRRDPRVSLVLMNDGFFGDWLQIEGTAEIVELPEAMELLVAYYRDISGEHADWEDYRAAMQRDRRVMIQVTMTKVGPDFHG